MEVRPIHTGEDYKIVMHEVSTYFENEPEPGTHEGDSFEVLLTLVEACEPRNIPIE